jgi:hypothetical protein
MVFPRPTSSAISNRHGHSPDEHHGLLPRALPTWPATPAERVQALVISPTRNPFDNSGATWMKRPDNASSNFCDPQARRPSHRGALSHHPGEHLQTSAGLFVRRSQIGGCKLRLDLRMQIVAFAEGFLLGAVGAHSRRSSAFASLVIRASIPCEASARGISREVASYPVVMHGESQHGVVRQTQ